MNDNVIVAMFAMNSLVSFVALFISFRDRRMFMDCVLRGNRDVNLICDSIKEVVAKIGNHTHEIIVPEVESFRVLPVQKESTNIYKPVVANIVQV